MLGDVTIVIPTSRREAKQTTLIHLPPCIRQRTRLAVYKREKETYQRLWPDQPLWVIPNWVQNIGQKRRYLIERTKTRYLLMLDDDLRICYKPDMSDKKLIYMQPEDQLFIDFFHRLRYLADKYPHVGACYRTESIQHWLPYRVNKKMRAVLFYDVVKVRESGIEWSRIPLMQDYDVTLQLLRKGYKNAVLYRWSFNHTGMNNDKGGCSSYRTQDLHRQCALQLKEYHEDFVTVIEKRSKMWANLVERTDVRCYWDRAYKASRKGRAKVKGVTRLS